MATRTHLRGLLLVIVAATATVGCDTGEGQATIGPRGGVVTSVDGRITLDIPAGALDHDVAFSIGELDDGPEGQLGSAYEIEPALTVFHQPATLTVDLAAGDEADDARWFDLAGAGMALSDVTVVAEKSSGWAPLPDMVDDQDAMTLSGSVLFTTTVAVVPR